MGTWTSTAITGPRLAGAETNVPVLRLGVDSPRIVIVALLHGDEWASVLLLHRIHRGWADRWSGRGCLELIPVANPLAAAFGEREAPLDGGDLNRVPSRVQGYTAELRKSLLAFLEGADLVLLCHAFESVGSDWVGVTYRGLPERIRAGRLRCLEQMGCPAIWEIDDSSEYARPFEETIDFALAKRGVLSAAVEVFTQDRDLERSIRSLSDGLLRVSPITDVFYPMRARDKNLPSVVLKRHDFIAPLDGLYHPDLNPLAAVNAGERIGRLISADLQNAVDVEALASGILLCNRPIGSRRRGEILYSLGLRSQ